DYMMSEFLGAGISVIYDTNAMRLSERRRLREIARKAKAESLLVWLQIDLESAFGRVVKRDRRRVDDKYSVPLDRTTFDSLIHRMQNPTMTEDYVFISGKHTFTTQKHMVTKKLRDMRLVRTDLTDSKVVKPGLVNLIPNP